MVAGLWFAWWQGSRLGSLFFFFWLFSFLFFFLIFSWETDKERNFFVYSRMFYVIWEIVWNCFPRCFFSFMFSSSSFPTPSFLLSTSSLQRTPPRFHVCSFHFAIPRSVSFSTRIFNFIRRGKPFSPGSPKFLIFCMPRIIFQSDRWCGWLGHTRIFDSAPSQARQSCWFVFSAVFLRKKKNIEFFFQIDVAAKDGSQETAVNLIGLILGLVITPLLDLYPSYLATFFLFFTFLHLFANYKAVRNVIMDTLNRSRASVLLSEFFTSQTLLSPTECNRRESVFQLLPFFFL